MNGNEGFQGTNSIEGSGNNITAGTFTGSQVTSVSGRRNEVNVGATDSPAALSPGMADLAKELARIRLLLENDHGAGGAADRDDALDAVTALQRDLPGIAASGPGAPTSLRRRLKGLLGALDPVVKIIGTAATLQGILDHLH